MSLFFPLKKIFCLTCFVPFFLAIHIELKILGIKAKGMKNKIHKVESKSSHFSGSRQTQVEQVQYLTQHEDT